MKKLALFFAAASCAISPVVASEDQQKKDDSTQSCLAMQEDEQKKDDIQACLALKEDEEGKKEANELSHTLLAMSGCCGSTESDATTKSEDKPTNGTDKKKSPANQLPSIA